MDISSKRSTLWLLVGGAALIVGMLMWCAGLHVRFSSTNQLFLWISASAMCLVYRPPDNTWQQKLLDSMEFAALLSLIGTIGAFGSYAEAALTTHYADDLLASLDRSIGFDWVAGYDFVRANPWLSVIGKIAYVSIFISPTVLILAFAWTGRRVEARRFLFAFGVALALTLLLSTFFIAQGAIEYHVGAAPAYVPQTGVHQAPIIRDLRAGTLDWVDPARLAGLLTFPSFHAASAILFIWAAWPIRWLRGPMLAVNLCMLAATPIEGGHYLVDVFGGMAMAALGIASLRFTLAPTRRAAGTSLEIPALDAPAAAGAVAL